MRGFGGARGQCAGRARHAVPRPACTTLHEQRANPRGRHAAGAGGQVAVLAATERPRPRLGRAGSAARQATALRSGPKPIYRPTAAQAAKSGAPRLAQFGGRGPRQPARPPARHGGCGWRQRVAMWRARTVVSRGGVGKGGQVVLMLVSSRRFTGSGSSPHDFSSSRSTTAREKWIPNYYAIMSLSCKQRLALEGDIHSVSTSEYN